MLMALASTAIIVVFIAISQIEMHNTTYDMTLLNLLFETVSAFGTVGLSMGVTPYLLPASKIILSLLMFTGRLGPITIFGILNRNWGHPYASSVEYPSEKILVG